MQHSGGSVMMYQRRGHSWPQVESGVMSLHDHGHIESSSGYLVHETGQTSVGMEPSESIEHSHEEGSLQQGSLVESNDLAESSAANQVTLHLQSFSI